MNNYLSYFIAQWSGNGVKIAQLAKYTVTSIIHSLCKYIFSNVRYFRLLHSSIFNLEKPICTFRNFPVQARGNYLDLFYTANLF